MNWPVLPLLDIAVNLLATARALDATALAGLGITAARRKQIPA